MVWAFDALYVGVNDYERKIPSGLYRITDSDGDDELDKVEMLRAMEARGDHGVHAVVPSPDGKSLFLITGNSTKPAEFADNSQVPQIWGEDHLLPSFPDGRGHNRGVLAPGGIIYKVIPMEKTSKPMRMAFAIYLTQPLIGMVNCLPMMPTWSMTLMCHGTVLRGFVR